MLLVIQSIIVYGLIMWVMTHFGKVAYRSQYPLGFGNVDRYADSEVPLYTLFTKPYFLIPIFIFCLFAALRFRVGADCESYKESFYNLGIFGYIRTGEVEIEPGFVFLSNFAYNITGTHYLLFFILAFLQIGTYYYSLRKERYALVYLGVALFLSGEYWSWMNGMRQNIAACAFVAIIPFIIQKKWLYAAIIIILATLMHKSALILVPLTLLAYFLKDKIPNRYVQLAILSFCFIMMNRFNGILASISSFAAYAGYAEKSIEMYSELEERQINFGFRMIMIYIVHIIAIWFSENMKKTFNSQIFNICYNFYFIGICCVVLFFNNFTIRRILYYMIIFSPLIISLLLFFLNLHKKKYRLIFFVCIFALLMAWSYNLYSASLKPLVETLLYKFDL